MSMRGIEGNPFITRFKTQDIVDAFQRNLPKGIEGNPFITRFKTCKNRESELLALLKY